MSALRAEGHDLGRLLACSGLARSTYYYALSHPAKPTRPELRGAVAEIFMRTANGCGHRQVAMCLRAELGARVADKTVLKIMREMGIRCGIRRETDYHRYSSYRGVVGETFENIVGRDFSADGPWRKMGTDVTEFKQPWGKAYFAPVYEGARRSWRGRRPPAPTWSSRSSCSTGCWRGCRRARGPCCTRTWAGSTSMPAGAGG